MTAQIKMIREIALPILYKAGITRSAIFGSYARNEQTEKSDIDILVEIPDKFSLFDLSSLKFELEGLLGKNVDLVSYKFIKPRLKKNILSDESPL